MSDDEKLMAWRDWFNVFVVEDIKRAIDDERELLQVGLIILSLLHTEALSGYYFGTKAEKKTFVPFVLRYFPATYYPLAEDIYILRNQLAHDYISEKFALKGKRGEPHLMPAKPGEPLPIAFNRIAIAEDFVHAWDQYSLDVLLEEDLRRKALARIALKGFMVVGRLP